MMPPLRSVILMASVVALLWLIPYQFARQNFPLFAQSETNVADPAGVLVPDDTLTIVVDLTSDSPIGRPKAVGELVTLTATVRSNVPGLTFSWNFGDNTTSDDNTRVIRHSYLRTGTFRAVVFVTNGIESGRAETTVEIETPTPTPTRSPCIEGLRVFSDQPTVAGNPTSFFATIEQGTGVTYEWNFGDGTPPVEGGISIGHIYQSPGQYTARVRAFNNICEEKVDTTLVTIEDAPPQSIVLFMPTSVPVNTSATFSATVASGTNLRFEWVVSDGTVWRDPVESPLRRISVYTHPSFKEAKPHTVTVYARNWRGEVVTAKSILVRDRPPVLLNILPPVPREGTTLEFTEYVVSASAVNATWHWGDNTEKEIVTGQEQDGVTPKRFVLEHTFPAAGRYFVQSLFQNSGGWVAGNQVVRVDLPEPQPNTTIKVSPLPRAGESVTFSLTSTLVNPNCTWYFGHNTTTVGNANTTISYPYSKAGYYVVYARCLDNIIPKVALVYEAEELIYVSGNLFMPAAANAGEFAPLLPQGSAPIIATPTLRPTPALPPNTPTVTPTATDTPTETPTATDTRTPTPTLIPPTPTLIPPTPTLIPPTPTLIPPTPTATPTETPTLPAVETETPTATPTPPVVETATETPTETPTMDPGGTIPQP